MCVFTWQQQSRRRQQQHTHRNPPGRDHDLHYDDLDNDDLDNDLHHDDDEDSDDGGLDVAVDVVRELIVTSLAARSRDRRPARSRDAVRLRDWLDAAVTSRAHLLRALLSDGALQPTDDQRTTAVYVGYLLWRSDTARSPPHTAAQQNGWAESTGHRVQGKKIKKIIFPLQCKLGHLDSKH